MRDIDLVLSLAERVKRLRAELADAELQLERVVRGDVKAVSNVPKLDGRALKSLASKPTSISSTSAKTTEPVSIRVARFIAKNGASEFGAILKGVQPATRAAVKSALNNARKKKQMVFRNGLYGEADKRKPRQARAQRGPVESSSTTS